ncbi:Zinc/iron permease [Tirmania nivea]|nr:Zinc/iron permease [Tirmania nivea]
MAWASAYGEFWPAQSNDVRGWVLSLVSGVACVLGSSIICVDLLTKHIPRWRHFSIRENSTFLSASLSLSFGVMIFSALYGILPEANIYLTNGGKSPQAAKFMSIGFFMVGVIGLSLVSEILHRCLPSSIVRCEHGGKSEHEAHHQVAWFASDIDNDDVDEHGPHEHYHDINEHSIAVHQTDGNAHVPMSEATPLLQHQHQHPHPPTTPRAPSLKLRLSGSVASLVARKGMCVATGDGKCYGYTESPPCDRMCLGHTKTAKTFRAGSMRAGSLSDQRHPIQSQEAVVEIPQQDVERALASSMHSHDGYPHSLGGGPRSVGPGHHSPTHAGHHHVPKNEFLSIGLQTSLAIALHKIPEGFITFATNHVNPRLGFAVFLALSIHNISEGFIISLPLFLAFKSRILAMFWASLLGGLSQPAGALCAYLWFRSTRDGDGNEDVGSRNVVYGVLFAITAGIMCNVALLLYGQAVGIYHSQRLPMVCAFVGMGVLGVSFAMTQEGE